MSTSVIMSTIVLSSLRTYVMCIHARHQHAQWPIALSSRVSDLEINTLIGHPRK